MIDARAVGGPFKQSEAQFMAQVIKAAELFGWRVWHDRATNQRRTCAGCGAVLACERCSRRVVPVRNAAGMVDLLMIRRPRVIWAELKSDRGTLTDDQRAWLEELRSCGQEAYVWRPRDWQRLEDLLR